MAERVVVEAADNEVDNDENEFILDAQEADIPRIKAKPANKTLPKMPNLNQPLPPPVLRSLFSFSALRHSRSSIKNPIHYGTAIIKSRMFYSFEPLHYISRLHKAQNLSQHFENEIK